MLFGSVAVKLGLGVEGRDAFQTCRVEAPKGPFFRTIGRRGRSSGGGQGGNQTRTVFRGTAADSNWQARPQFSGRVPFGPGRVFQRVCLRWPARFSVSTEPVRTAFADSTIRSDQIKSCAIKCEGNVSLVIIGQPRQNVASQSHASHEGRV